jgi:hypothetical protein
VTPACVQSLCPLGSCASWDVWFLATKARGSFADRRLFPPACAIGTLPRPTRRECLGCSRVGLTDHTPSLRAGNLHGFPSTTAPSRKVPFDGSRGRPAALPTHTIRLPCRRTGDQWGRRRARCTKTCRSMGRRAVEFVLEHTFPGTGNAAPPFALRPGMIHFPACAMTLRQPTIMSEAPIPRTTNKSHSSASAWRLPTQRPPSCEWVAIRT